MAVSYLGEFEHLVLLAILQLEGGAYGVTIRRELREKADRRVSLGAVYSALRRLEAKRLVQSAHGEPEPRPGGRAKKYFSVTGRGVETLRHVHERISRLSEGLPAL